MAQPGGRARCSPSPWPWPRARCIMPWSTPGFAPTPGWRWRRAIAATCTTPRFCSATARARSARGWRWKQRAVSTRKRAKPTCCTPSTSAWPRSCRRWAFRCSTAIAARTCSTSSAWTTKSWSVALPARLRRSAGIGFAELEAALRDVWAAAQDEDSQPALVNAVHQQSQPPTATAQQPAAQREAKVLARLRLGSLPQRRSCRAARLAAADGQGPADRGRHAPAARRRRRWSPAQAWTAFSTQAAESKPTVLRDLLEIRPAAAPLALEQVEAASAIVQPLHCVRHVAGFAEPGGAPDHHRGHEPARRALQYRRGWRRSGSLSDAIPGAPAILEQQGEAGGLRALWRHHRIPGPCRGDRDQDLPGLKAWRRRPVAWPQGHGVDRAPAPCAARGRR